MFHPFQHSYLTTRTLGRMKILYQEMRGVVVVTSQSRIIQHGFNSTLAIIQLSTPYLTGRAILLKKSMIYILAFFYICISESGYTTL